MGGLRYLTRWRIEETIRFTKQSYDLEDIRVMTYDRLRNMVALVNAVAFFTAVVLGPRVKLHVLANHLITAAKRLFGVPNFRYYALADGIPGSAPGTRGGHRPARLIHPSPAWPCRRIFRECPASGGGYILILTLYLRAYVGYCAFCSDIQKG